MGGGLPTSLAPAQCSSRLNAGAVSRPTAWVGQKQCGRVASCQALQPGHPSPQQAPTQRNSSSSSGSSYGSAHSAAQRHWQQQHQAGQLLERAAAAMRPAGPPHEASVASSSSSSDNTASRAHGYPRSGAGSSSNGRAGRVHLPVRASAGAAAAALPSAADSLADAFAQPRQLQPRPSTTQPGSSGTNSNSTPYSNGNSSNGAGRAVHQGLTAPPGRASPPAAAAVNGDLMQHIRGGCLSCDDVAVLFRDRGDDFTAQHCAAALYQLTVLWQALLQLAPQQAQVFSHVSMLQRERAAMQQLGGSLLRALSSSSRMAGAGLRDLADAWYAVDTLGLLQTHAAAAATDAAASTSPSAAAAAAAAAPAAGTAAFVSASLQHSRGLPRRQQVQLRHLSRLLTSFAHLGVRPDGDWWMAALDAAAGGMEQVLQQPPPPPLQQQQQQQGSTGRNVIAAGHTNAQAVSLLGWAVAALQGPASPAWWQLFQAASAHLMPGMRASHLTACLHACASTRQAPDAAWMARFYAACSRDWAHFSPQGFATILWGCAALGQAPPRDWLVGLDAASAAKLPWCSLQHLGISLWALARLQRQQQQHGEQQQLLHHQQALVGAAAGSAHLPSPQQQQQQVPSAAWQDQAWVQLSRLEVDARSPQGLATLLWGIVRLQLQVPQPRWQELEGMCLEGVRHMGPQALAVVMWALGVSRGPAVNRRLPRRVCSRCMQQPALLQQLTPQGLCMLLSGLARMDAWQPDSFKRRLAQEVASRAVDGPAQQSLSGKKQRRKQQQQQLDGLDAATPSQPHQPQQPQGVLAAGAPAVSSSGGSSSSMAEGGRFQTASLPHVLLYLRQLQVAAPAEALCATEATLQQQLQTLPVSQLCLGLFALAASKHTADSALLSAALGRVVAQLQSCRGLDVAHLLFCLAVMSSWGGDLRATLQQPEQQAQLHRLVMHAQQLLPGMDHRALAMLLWSLGRLQLHPSEAFLQDAMASTLRHMPSMSLLSVVTILSSLRALHYLPPVPWMVEVCSAARAKVGSDSSAKLWQRRDCVRRFEETVAWFNQALLQQTGAPGSPESSVDGGEEQQALAGSRQRPGARRMGRMLTDPGSEAVLAAAVGVAAAVAQSWHP